MQMARLRLGNNRTAQVGAELVVSDPGLFVQTDQQARVVRLRVVKDKRASHRQLIQAGNLLQGQLTSTPPQKILSQNRKLSNRKSQADQPQKLGKIAPGDVIILRPVNRKIAPPEWLFRLGPAVRGDGQVFGIF
jgi:hypothetical protein